MLDATLRVLDATIKELKANEKRTHEKLFGKVDEHEKRLGDHETRIQILENIKEEKYYAYNMA